jgi:plastocyanin
MSILQTRKRSIGRLAAVAASFLLVVGLAACGGKTAARSSAPPASSAAPAAAATVDVLPDPATIGAFTPATVTITVGQSVEWVFKDANPHTATADDGSFSSVASGLSNGQTYSHTFTKAGTYPYHCAIHPQMHGTVIVH